MNPNIPEWLDQEKDPKLVKTLSALKTHADNQPEKIVNASFSGSLGVFGNSNGEFGTAPLSDSKFTGSLAPTIAEINENRRTIVKQKKAKIDYRLYPLYEQLIGMLANNKDSLDELFAYGEKGSEQENVLLYTECAKHFSSIDAEHKNLVDEIYNLYVEVKDKPAQCRDDWVREKVVQTRYTNKGREYASRMGEIGDSIFALSALVADFQSRLYQVLANSGEFNED